VKLRFLEQWTEARRAHPALYDKLLEGCGVTTPQVMADVRHVYHVYAVRVQDRNQVLQAMSEKGIGCAIHYPIPVHLQEAYRSLGLGPGAFPVAERCAEEFLSLPMFPELSREQIQAVAHELKLCLSAAKPQGAYSK